MVVECRKVEKERWGRKGKINKKGSMHEEKKRRRREVDK